MNGHYRYSIVSLWTIKKKRDNQTNDYRVTYKLYKVTEVY